MRLGAPLLLLLVAAAGCAGSKGPLTVDDLDTDIPHRSLEAACAALNPPSADGSFVFAADVFDEDTKAAAGTLHVAVETGSFHEQPAWFVEETWDDAGGRGRGPRHVKRARTWLARDLRLLSAVVDVETTRADAGVEKVHSEFGPTANGCWITVDRGDGFSSREESPSAGPTWARSFAGAMVFVRACAAESALYAGRRGDYMTVRVGPDGTMTLSGFAEMSIKVRADDRAPLSLREHVWELTPRRFEVRGTPR